MDAVAGPAGLLAIIGPAACIVAVALLVGAIKLGLSLARAAAQEMPAPPKHDDQEAA